MFAQKPKYTAIWISASSQPSLPVLWAVLVVVGLNVLEKLSIFYSFFTTWTFYHSSDITFQLKLEHHQICLRSVLQWSASQVSQELVIMKTSLSLYSADDGIHFRQWCSICDLAHHWLWTVLIQDRYQSIHPRVQAARNERHVCKFWSIPRTIFWWCLSG